MNPLLRKFSLMGAAAVVSGLVAVGTASAVVIGSDLSTSPSTPLGIDLSGTQVAAPTGAPNPVASPMAGVLVRIRQRYGGTDANPGSVAFRVLSGSNPAYTARPATVDGSELRFPLLADLAAGSDAFVDYQPVDSNGRPIGIPIATGERLGVAQQHDGPGSARILAVAAAGEVGFTAGQHLNGSQDYNSNPLGMELAVQGVVEPDADGDGRGDLTQDQCPTVANDAAGLCPLQLVTRAVTTEVKVRKCRVPLLRGLTRRFASRLLTASGCALGKVKSRVVRRGPRGRVLAQSARANRVVGFGAKVGITLSKRAARHRRH